MADRNVTLTGVERTFGDDDIIVSKTDLKGRLVYANDIFIGLSGYTEEETLDQPHSMVRHPDMPRCVFKLLWDAIQAGDELFAYVVNRSKNGDHYWVNAHVTPNLDFDGNAIGYHSSRRVPTQQALDVIRPLYKTLCSAEENAADRKIGLEISHQMLTDILKDKGVRYDQFVLSL